MKTTPFVVALGLSLTLAGSAYRAQAAPLFLNGVVVAADLARARITIERTDGKALSLPVEGDARSMLSSLSKGDRVILGGRESADGGALAAVTEIRRGHAPARAPAGTPGRKTSEPEVIQPSGISDAAAGRADGTAPVVVVEAAPPDPARPSRSGPPGDREQPDPERAEEAGRDRRRGATACRAARNRGHFRRAACAGGS